MNNQTPFIAVLWDGTSNTEKGFRHAVVLHQQSQQPILLLSVVRKKNLFESSKSYSRFVEENAQKLASASSLLALQYGVNVEHKLLYGCTKECIVQLDNDFKCSILIAPEQYEPVGMKKVYVADRLATCPNISIPTIIANSNPMMEKKQINVIVPLIAQSEYKSTLGNIVALASEYGCKLSLTKLADTHQNNNDLISNLYFSQEVLESCNIDYEITRRENSTTEGKGSKSNRYFLCSPKRYSNMKKHKLAFDLSFLLVNPGVARYKSFL